MKLHEELTSISGVGAKTAQLFSRLNVRTVEDLIHLYPRRYEDYSQVMSIASLNPGQITVKAKITRVKSRYGRARGTHITEAIATDDTDSLSIVWFNQPYRASSIKEDAEYYLSGMFDYGGGKLQLVNPNVEVASDIQINTARILPVYPQTKGLTSKKIRAAVANLDTTVFQQVRESLPQRILDEFNLRSYGQTLRILHSPSSSKELMRCRREMGFRELFPIMLSSQLLRVELEQKKSAPIELATKELQQLTSKLPFNLTDQQRLIAWQLLKELESSKRPLNTMVEGDVGSGKTIIAAMMALNVLASGKQVALMAPTEILARQHEQSLRELLEPFNYELVLLTGSLSAKDKESLRDKIMSTQPLLILGTHALFQDGVEFLELGLLIIDEQHRFGVDQRKRMQSKASYIPHVLTLTATPIPRSLALVLYGELDIKQLTEKPPGRKTIITELSRLNKRADLLKEHISKSTARDQLYIVCPAIEANDDQDSIEDIEKLINRLLPQASYEVLHGKLSSSEKESRMQAFVSGEVSVLLATTVIEVGVNVPAASRMIIISPERFGLAQ
ncbi:MAG: ATP-dependent DNA helicase RecG, partial [Patescibacteria group bacterium]